MSFVESSASPPVAVGGLPPLPPLPAGWRRDLAWTVLAFLVARLAVIAAFVLRGQGVHFSDTDDYVALARHIAETGTFTVDPALGARHFSGVPLLVAAVGRFTGEFFWSGMTLNLLLGVGAVALFYRNFPSVRLAVLHGLLLPAWVATTATLLSEAAQWCFVLLALTAFRASLNSIRRHALLVIAGYAIACRPTAGLLLLPIWWLAARRSFSRGLASALALGALPIAVACWERQTTGQWEPERAPQTAEFAKWNKYYGDAFSPTVFTFPGESLWIGVFHRKIGAEIKLLNLAHLLVAGVALVVAWRTWRSKPEDTLEFLIFAELALNTTFILFIGGPFGFTLFYRFLATQANAFVILALWRGLRVPPVIWNFAAAGSVILAACSSRKS